MTSNRESPDRFDSSWKEQAGQLLRGAKFDADLGQEAARDAQRLVAGDLSEAEFYQKYHSAYLKEFGIDLRQTSSGVEKEELMSDSFFKDGISRRTLLKVAGAGAAVLALNLWLGRRAALAATRDDIPRPTPVQYGMVIDLEKCDGCLACVAACKGHNGLDEGVYWLHIISYTDSNRDGVNLMPRFCNHCTNAPCIKVCPVGARFKRDDGLVLIDYNRCIGCRYCMAACPYGVNYFQWADPAYPLNIEQVSRGRWVAGRPPIGVMGKCTFCPERQDDPQSKGTTVCQLTCPHQVIHFGDLNDSQSEAMRYLEQKKKEKGYISAFRLREDFGTQPNVIYIGQQPSVYAKLAPLPQPYESLGWVAERKEVLDGPQPWFMKALGVKKSDSAH